MKKRVICLFLALILALALAGCGTEGSGVDYSEAANWAYAETERALDSDVFFVCPTVYGGGEDGYNMPLADGDAMADFLGATNMEKGIYDAESRFFAPYYRQAGLAAYALDEGEREQYLAAAYEDVEDAFDYYLENWNEGRPIILAGFSQGADLCLRLIKERFGDEELAGRLVACYAIGWRVTAGDCAEYPQLRFASGEDDTGVVIAFNSEAESITDSMMVPAGTVSLCINPLNWRTDSTAASKEENPGACFTDYSGAITSEIPQLCGAYIDPERGTLKVTDVTPDEYPPVLDLFEPGIYHLYDYQFFYRSLQENVAVRLAAWEAAEAAA